MTRRCHRHIQLVGTLVAAAAMALFTSAAALAQTVPVVVEVEDSETPTEPGNVPSDRDPTLRPPGDDPTTSPAPPPGEEPPPAAADPPEDPLPRTGADVLRTVRDAAALIAAGLLLLVVTRKPERTAR